jgi:hypothetical protein
VDERPQPQDSRQIVNFAVANGVGIIRHGRPDRYSKPGEIKERSWQKRRRKEKRFATDVNHQISKKMVDKALRHNLAIALEDLKGIREKTTVKKAQRRQHHS